MNTERVEQLLHELAQRLPPQRAFSEAADARVRRRLQQLALREAAGRVGPRTAARDWRVAALRLTACAAAVLLMLQGLPGLPAAAAPTFVADSAFERDALFRVQRSTKAAGERVYIGVRLREPATIRIVAIEADGRLTPMALDSSGAETLERDAGAHTFGGYALRSQTDSRAGTRTQFLVIATARPIGHARFERAIADWNARIAAAHAPDAQRATRELARSLHARVQVVDIGLQGDMHRD